MKLFLLLIALITFSEPLSAQVYMNLRTRIKDTLVIDKYEPRDNGFKMQELVMAPGSWHIKNERAAELLKSETITAIDLVYSDYPEGEDFTELNRRRLIELFGYLPEAFNRQVVSWRVVKQTGVIKTGGIQNYFHGFVVYPESTGTRNWARAILGNVYLYRDYGHSPFPRGDGKLGG